MINTILASAAAVLSLNATVPEQCTAQTLGNALVHVSCNAGKGFTVYAVYEPSQIGQTLTFAGDKIALKSIDSTPVFDSTQPAEGVFSFEAPAGVRFVVEAKR